MPLYYAVYWTPCGFCGTLMKFRRPPSMTVYCSSECLFGHESDLRKRVNAVVLPRQLREE